MAISERLALLVTLDAQGAVKSFNDLGNAAEKNLSKADTRLDRMGSKFQKAGAGMLATSGLLAVGLYKAGQAAGDLEQAVGGTEAVFGKASDAIDDYAKKAAQSAGLSESAFRTATTSIGGQLKGLGFNVNEAADQAIKLTQVAADLSATYGGTTAEAVAALGAAFRGEADPAERFNLFLNQTRVNAKAVELGLAASTSQVSAQAKAQATLALITEQSADAQGQFAREADTAQGSMARFKAETDNLLAALGSAVAPVLADVADGVGGLVERFNNLSPAQQSTISKFALLSTGALGAAGALSFTIGKVIDARERFGQLAGGLRNAEGGLNKFGKVAAGLGLVGIAVGIAEIASSANKATLDIDKLNRALVETSKAGKAANEENIRLLDQMGKLDDVVKLAAATDVKAAEGLIDLARSAGVPADKIAELNSIVEEKRVADVEGAKHQNAYAKEVADAAGPVAELTEKVDKQKAALDLATESADKFKQGLEDAFGDLTLEEAADRRAQALSDMAERFSDAQEAVRSAKQRVSDLLAIKPEDRSDTFSRDLADAQSEVQDAIDATSRSLEGNSEAALQNREDLRSVVEDIGNIIQAHRDEGDSLEDLQIIRARERDNLVQQLEQMGYNRDEIGRYVEAIDNIPITKATTITVDTAPALVRIKELAEALNAAAPGSVDAGIIDRNLQRASALANRAIGGPVTAGMGYSVNEYLGAGKGYEWYAPHNGTVYPAGTASATGTSIDQTVIINNPVPEPASKAGRHLRRAALEAAS